MRFGASASVGLPPPAGERTLPVSRRVLRHPLRKSWSTAPTRTSTCSSSRRAVRAIAGASCLPNGTVPPNLDRGLRAHAVAGPENYEVVGGRGETTTHCGRLDFTCMILAGVADGAYCVIRYDKHNVLMQAWTLEAHLLGFFSGSWSCGSSDGRGMSVACEVAGVERKMDRRDHDQA